ncbi:hypothetical protein QZH41_015182 [Actinostola sp. cb2023]|nr:hypothetical protein QZH41_015182 [Actinostola sp. cb2023]
MTKVNQENEEEDEVDLIAFGDEDLPVDESKLIDLDFDDSDQGLSQMSETQSQVMWDLFSQDQLYSPLDSLSQPEDSLLDSPPVEDTVSLGNSALPQTYQFKNAPEKAIFNCVVMKFGDYINSNVNNHICLAFLIGKCTKGSKCSEHHCPLPHQWIYMSGNQWIMLDEKENMELEKLFCEDNINDEPVVISMKLDLSSSASAMSHLHNVPYIYNVNLKSMQIGLLDDESLLFSLRRLSTMSKVLIPGCHLATTWYWYYKNEDDIYVEYQPSHGFKDPTSSTIEKFYQEGNSRYDFRVGNHDYRLYFVDMYQKNKDPVYGTKRDVMRRPELLYPDRAKNLIRTCKLPTPDSGELPPFWKRMTECQPFLLKKLNAKTKEFKEIQLLFFNTMGERQVNINSIDRVQNSFMWDKYQRKKNQMAKLAVDVDERSLFHGTAFRNIRSICKDNFDWRLYGQVTGNIYGEGAYFARDASFSHCYCHDDEDGVRYVFVAKVLVGSFTKGEKNYRRPPPKHPSDPHSELFDSCVDDVDSPQVFVMFDVDQYYPGHVIEYTCQPTEYPSAPTINNAGSRLSTSSNFASYYPSQSMIRQSVAMPTPVVTASAQASNLSLQRMNEELDKFASSSKKSDDSKQNCVVM